MKHLLSLKLGDVILMAAILFSAILMLVFTFFSDESSYAEIVAIKEDKIQTVNLNTDATYKINSQGITLEVCVADGEIFVKQSNCRDSICRYTPPISNVGQSIVCAPAGVVVRIVGEGAGIDGISG